MEDYSYPTRSVDETWSNRGGAGMESTHGVGFGPGGALHVENIRGFYNKTP